MSRSGGRLVVAGSAAWISSRKVSSCGWEYEIDES